jgi:hypothetical protein
MTYQCPRCGAPQPGALPICQQCGLDFRTIGAQPAPGVAAYQQAQPQPQAFQQPAPPPQGVPTVCPRCQAPLYPGYPICGNCGLDLRAAWGSGPAAGPARPMLPIALAIGLVVLLLAAAGAVFVMAQPKGSATPSQAIASSAILDSSPGGTGPKATPTTRTAPSLVVPGEPTPTAGPGGGVANDGNWTGLDTTTGIFTVTFTVSGNTMSALTIAYMGTSGDIDMWTDYSTLGIGSGSFDVSGFTLMAGPKGDTVRITGSFDSANAVSGTYEMHLSGLTVSGRWTGLPEA